MLHTIGSQNKILSLSHGRGFAWLGRGLVWLGFMRVFGVPLLSYVFDNVCFQADWLHCKCSVEPILLSARWTKPCRQSAQAWPNWLTPRGMQTSQSGLHPAQQQGHKTSIVEDFVCHLHCHDDLSAAHIFEGQAVKIEHMDNNRVEVVVQGKLSVQSVCQSNQSVSQSQIKSKITQTR